MEAGVSADAAHGTSTLVSAIGSLKSGWNSSKYYKAAAKNDLASAKHENEILRQYAQDAKGTSQRAAIEQERQAKLAQSRAVAVAAGSGAGASDPTVNKLVGDLAERGKYNALMALYSGDSEAQYYQNVMAANDYNAKASAAAYKFRAKASSGWDEAIGTILSGASGFLQKYGSDYEDTSDSQYISPGKFDRGFVNPLTGMFGHI